MPPLRPAPVPPPPPVPPPAPLVPGWQLVLMCVAAYALFWAVGRPLLPPRVLADRSAGLLPTLVAMGAVVSLLRRERYGLLLAFGGTVCLLTVYLGLMRMVF